MKVNIDIFQSWKEKKNIEYHAEVDEDCVAVDFSGASA